MGPPRMLIFDAALRESCNVRARVTNTPLQALVLMNDVTFVEAARGLGQRMMAEGGDKAGPRLAYGYRVAVGRTANPRRTQVLQESFDYFQRHFAEHPDEAKQFLAQGDSKVGADLPEVELAAYTAAAHLLLNLDETITVE